MRTHEIEVTIHGNVDSEALARLVAKREWMRGIESAMLPQWREPKFSVPTGNKYGGYFGFAKVIGPLRVGLRVPLNGGTWTVCTVRKLPRLGRVEVAMTDGQSTRFFESTDGQHFQRYVPS